MSKTNPNQLVETSAELARDAVLTVIVIKNRIVDSVRFRGVVFGTAFVIRSDDWGSIVLTAQHVVEDLQPGDTLRVRTMLQSGVRELSASVLYEHRWSDVAILSVPGLRNVRQLTFEPSVLNSDSVIGVGYANPIDLFPGIEMACKRIPDLSPGSVVSTEYVGLYQGVDVTFVHLEMVGMRGMSGMPILNATGVVAMLIEGEGAYSTAVSYGTVFQVLKAYLKIRLRHHMDAPVDTMTMEQVLDALH
ncbi:uncharacterized protein LOC127777685 [Oryza glaberrima]|uniref:Trypsin-like peptidase domain-containing protein n=1 Tax=Oryza barthii TaxID=65489 RepID=A0A0D3GCN2_9ORYZ|nr:uncharacterized protein LOC127777685 [Oryza glaberrima]